MSLKKRTLCLLFITQKCFKFQSCYCLHALFSFWFDYKLTLSFDVQRIFIIIIFFILDKKSCFFFIIYNRTTRETTPCSLIRNPDIIRTPGSSTKRNRKNRVQNTTPRPIPSTTEMDEFFTEPEKYQQRVFMEKYIYIYFFTYYSKIIMKSQVGFVY